MKSNWNPWEDALKVEDETVLVKFEFENGRIHIEVAEILKNPITGQPEYFLFDGEKFNVNVKPVAWMEIPK